ncbi:MAG: hypothetical protein JEY91_07700 [Spirochaetaceae bacterium]|nr:hypothetical protein [Spirochaetaceae bacterium]
MRQPGKLIIIFAILLTCVCLQVFSEIALSSEQTDLGWIIEITNHSDRDYDGMVISASPDYKPESGQFLVEPGKTVTLEIKSAGDSDQRDEPVYIRMISDHPENPGLLTLGNAALSNTFLSTEKSSPGILLEYYYTPACSSCREFLEREIPLLEEKLELLINVRNINITEPDGLIAMNTRLKSLKSSEKKLPLLISGDVILAGDKAITEELESLLLSISEGKNLPLVTGDISEDSSRLKLSVLPILLAGLLDGINPCAFSTLIFLLSWLTLAGRDRRQILLTGIFFSSAVFLTYYTVGLGAFTALRSSETVPLIASALKYAMALLMVILGIIHIIDYRKVRQGRSGEITLQLSKERKKKIHSLIRGKARQAGLFAGSITLGVLVTIYELGCTGQVYLPTLMYMVRIERALSSYFLLGLYNLAFIIPLIIVFIAAWKGIGSEKLTLWFQKNLAGVKLLSALFFILMAGLLVLF